ncbi:MAG: dipeptidase E [Lachnospiraceae bacterium]|nr:dipeptidase E [Lachnospiraceae bacterium]
MKAILTSSLGYSDKKNGARIPTPLADWNGMAARIRGAWKEQAKVMILCASPEDPERNDSILYCMRESFRMSSLDYSEMLLIDARTEAQAAEIPEADVLILTGGHVPTENAFFRRIGLKEKLEGFQGLILAWSAGSMNAAELVYAGPELPGEALDPEFLRWIPGLGITKINIFPHFQALREEMLDGMRLIEDITLPDSMGHELIALCDGSYLVTDGGTETVYGEAYSILDGRIRKLCNHGESIVLEA